MRHHTVAAAAVLLVALGAPLAPAAPAHAEDAGCRVTAGTLSWGVKERFRSYISGSIAKGGWEAFDGAEYETPSFRWSGATGSVDPASGAGTISFPGGVRFTGHGGALDLSLANPTISVSGDGSAVLRIDATGTDPSGEPAVAETQVVFAQLGALGPLDAASGAVTLDQVPAVLTESGAPAFADFYAPGDELDPLSLALEFAPCEGAAEAPEDSPAVPISEPVELTQAPPTADAGGDAGPPWLLIGSSAAALAAAVAAIVLVARKRRATDAAPHAGGSPDGAASAGPGTPGEPGASPDAPAGKDDRGV